MENRTLAALAADAYLAAEKEGVVGEKLFMKKLGIARPTAVKICAAFKLGGRTGKGGRKGEEFIADDGFYRDMKLRAEKYPSAYIPLVEADKDFKRVSVDSYIKDVLLPALLIGLTFGGSVSPMYLQRKLGVVIERAEEIFALLDVAGLVGDTDETNPSRRKLAAGLADYDSLLAEFG